MIKISIENIAGKIDHDILAKDGEEARDKLVEWLKNCAFLAHGDRFVVTKTDD